MCQQVRTEPKRKPTLTATERTLPIMHGPDMCFQMRFRLKLKPATLAWKLSHLFVNNLYPHHTHSAHRMHTTHQSQKEHTLILATHPLTQPCPPTQKKVNLVQRTKTCLVRSLLAPNKRPQYSHACGRNLSCTLRMCLESCPLCENVAGHLSHGNFLAPGGLADDDPLSAGGRVDGIFFLSVEDPLEFPLPFNLAALLLLSNLGCLSSKSCKVPACAL